MSNFRGPDRLLLRWWHRVGEDRNRERLRELASVNANTCGVKASGIFK